MAGERGESQSGVFEYLEGVSRGERLSILTKRTWILLSKEEVCDTTGGSCMDLAIRQRGVLRNLHITDRNQVERLTGTSWYWDDADLFRRQEEPAPDIKDMLKTLKRFLSRERRNGNRFTTRTSE